MTAATIPSGGPAGTGGVAGDLGADRRPVSPWDLLDGGMETVELVEVLLARTTQALDDLAAIDLTDLDAGGVETMVVGTEALHRSAGAATIRVTSHVDTARPFRGDGFHDTIAYLKHRLQLSGPEAHQRVLMARQSPILSRWLSCHAAGAIGHAQFRLMARISTNPRIDPDILETGSLQLWCDALECSSTEFERRALTWEALADPAGALTKAERAHARRDVQLKPSPTGGWTLTGNLDDIGGAEFNDIFARYTDIEWRNDWHEATQRLGPDADITITDLRRTQAQRRCDALIAMARSAATNGNGTGGRSAPTVNLLIDHDTARSIITGEPIDPARYRTVVARTATGHPIHPRHIMNCAMWAHIRRVVTDTAGVVIDLGRRSRLFTRTARDAVMVTQTECAWIGCDTPTHWCDADHTTAWKAHGPTVPRNGGPLCRTHNLHKEHGYQIVRSPDGTWHTHHPDGHEIL